MAIPNVENIYSRRRSRGEEEGFSRYLDELKNHVREFHTENSIYADQIAMMRVVMDQIAVSREGDDMSDVAEKLHSIDKRLAVTENEIKHISNDISEMKTSISKLDEKLEKVIDRLGNVVTKEDLKESTDRKRFSVTTWIALGGLVFGAIAAVAAIFY